MNEKIPRLHVVDALRGFAIVSIMLLHNIEHFDFYYLPTNLPEWMIVLDKWIWDGLFFLFGGKVYAIFALLFGLTFYIQSKNQENKGKDFRGRFAWRLIILFFFGLINSTFYQGDILLIYAVIGFVLIPVVNLSDRVVFFIAGFLMLQPYELYNFFNAIQNPNMTINDPVSWSYFSKTGEYITGNSMIDTWIGNLTIGKTAVVLWNWENGRIFQTASLFMLGILAGRKSLFEISEKNISIWKNTLGLSTIIFIPLYIIKIFHTDWINSVAINRPLGVIISSYSNMAFMLVLVSGFVLLYQSKFFHQILNLFTSIGKMSLSNYIIQSIIGSFIYYGYGLGLYQYTGSTYCLLIGIVLATLQGYFSFWYTNKYKRGPLETIWHKGTWIGSKS